MSKTSLSAGSWLTSNALAASLWNFVVISRWCIWVRQVCIVLLHPRQSAVYRLTAAKSDGSVLFYCIQDSRQCIVWLHQRQMAVYCLTASKTDSSAWCRISAQQHLSTAVSQPILSKPRAWKKLNGSTSKPALHVRYALSLRPLLICLLSFIQVQVTGAGRCSANMHMSPPVRWMQYGLIVSAIVSILPIPRYQDMPLACSIAVLKAQSKDKKFSWCVSQESFPCVILFLDSLISLVFLFGLVLCPHANHPMPEEQTVHFDIDMH